MQLTATQKGCRRLRNPHLGYSQRYVRAEMVKGKIYTKELTKMELFSAVGMVVLIHLAIIAALVGVINMSTTYWATVDVTNNGMIDILSSGVFDSRSGLNSSATHFFTRVAEGIFAIALPFMSAFAITMTTISLISSVIYLTQPETFDEIDRLHQDRKDKKKITELIEYGKNAGFRDFILSLCPNFRAYAFNDATQVGPDGQPTMQDFLKTIPKYIMIFAFCIVINDRAMLDFIMKGAQVGALVFERITYDYDYVDTVSQWLDEGSDYKPIRWDTKTNEGANKMKVYREIYKKLKTRIVNEVDRTTDAKTEMGIKLEELIDGPTFAGVGWDKDILTINVSYVATPQSTNVDGIYTIPVSSLLASDTGVIHASIHTENQLKYNTTFVNTTYAGAWTNGTNGIPTSFDFKKIDELKMVASGSLSEFKGAVKVSVSYVDPATGKASVYEPEASLSANGTVTVSTGSITPGNISSVRITPVGKITYKLAGSGTNTKEKTLSVTSSITWKNDKFNASVTKK